MNYANYDDVVAQLRSAGLVLDSVKRSQGGTLAGELYVESSRSVRCDVGDERKKQSGAYWLHELRLDDGIWLTGAYWVDHGNASFKIELRKLCSKCGADMPLRSTTCSACGSKKSKAREIPPEQLEAHKKRMIEARRQADAEAAADGERAAAWADAVWLKCREVESTGDHDYLVRKKLGSAYGARLFESNDGVILAGAEKEDYEYLARFHGALVVPMLDRTGRRRGLQFILSRGAHKDWIARRDGRDKEYWPRGMIKPGLHFMIGGQMHGVGLVAEGYATAASLYEATNIPVAVAFDAGNLGTVGETIWKESRKRTRLLFCADDDWLQRCSHCKKITRAEDPACRHCGEPHGKHNAGIERARDAALATSGAWIAPNFSAARPEDRKGPNDFNDLRCLEGEQAVGGQVMSRISALEWLTSPTSGGPSRTAQGGGDGENLTPITTPDEIFERFSVVYGLKDAVFDAQEHLLVSQSELRRITAGRHNYRLWDESPNKTIVRATEVGFDPAGNDPNIRCNLFGGWPTAPKSGCCEKLLTLLSHLCAYEGDKSVLLFDWVIRWLAYPIQHPGAKMRSTIILHGPQGTGKNLFLEAVMAIYGVYGGVIDQAAIEDKHNDWASRKLFLIADEVVARMEIYHIKNKIKALVTGEWIRINPKFVGAYTERNHVNMVFLSNEFMPAALERDDRRHCVLWTPEKLDKSFYREVLAEIRDGGVAALHEHLLNVDLADFEPGIEPPMTRAKEDLIELGMDSTERFWMEWIGKTLPLPVCICRSEHLYDAYRHWCNRNGVAKPAQSVTFLGACGKRPGAWKVIKRFYQDKHTSATRQGMVIYPPFHDRGAQIREITDGVADFFDAMTSWKEGNAWLREVA